MRGEWGALVNASTRMGWLLGSPSPSKSWHVSTFDSQTATSTQEFVEQWKSLVPHQYDVLSAGVTSTLCVSMQQRTTVAGHGDSD
jgi:hypothetical protein